MSAKKILTPLDSELINQKIDSNIIKEDPVNRVNLNEKEIEKFKEDGALSVQNLFPPETTAILKSTIQKAIAGGDSSYGNYGDFARMKYDLAKSEQVVREILGSNHFKQLFEALISSRLLFTQDIGFELLPGKSGFPWHFGYVSFSYVKPTENGYTLWIPLDEIDPKKQRGGMEYIPEKTFSAEGPMKLLYECSEDSEDFVSKVGGKEVIGDFGDANRLQSYIFDRTSIEPKFSVGDAFLFNRNVWHKSVEILPNGPISSRLAYVMRFVPSDAKYSKESLNRIESFFGKMGNNPKTEFGRSFTDIQDGEALINSKKISWII